MSTANNSQLSTLNYQLPTGYKQTEVGVIPDDWKVTTLAALGKFKNGLNKDKESFGHGSTFVNLMDVFGVNAIDSANHLGLVASTKSDQEMYNLSRGDVLFIRSSVKPSGVGLTAVVERDLPSTVFSGFLIRFRDNGALATGYKKYCFYEEAFRSRIMSASSVSANTNINQSNLSLLKIPLPPTKAEQEAIAGALSDADAWIESLEQLIAKKRRIKEGSMQALLTGKQRLPGFSGEWEERYIGDITDITTGSRNTQDKIKDGQFPFFVRSQKVERIDSYSFDGEAVLTAGDGVGTGKVFHYINGKFDTHQRVYLISGFGEQLDGYFFYLYFSNHFYERIMQMTAKSSVDSVRMEMISRMPILLPPTKAEQTAIADILSDMDTELDALATKLSKARQIKQGMMQELLTGKTRLV
jgi:type I restriction enzyme S subunit